MAHNSWLSVAMTLLLGSACTIQNYYPAPVAAPSPGPVAVIGADPTATTAPPVMAEPVTAEPVTGEPVTTAPVATSTVSPLPTSAKGQILYSQLTQQGTYLIGAGPLLALSPDAPDQRVTVQSLSSLSFEVAGGLVGGYNSTARQFWTLDLRRGQGAMIPAGIEIHGLTTDGRIVSRCRGGLDDAFELCTYDRTGAQRTTVMTEAGIPNEAALVEGVGGTRVLGDYANLTRAPFIFDLATGQRRDLPGLRRADWKYVTRPVISSSGALVAHCFVGDKRDSLVIANLDTGHERSIDLGELTRCECEFSPDDRMLACGILPAKPGFSGKPDQLLTIDLASGKRRLLSSTMLIASFAFSPDSRELVYAATRAPDHDEYRLGIVSVTGGATRDLAPWGADKDLVGWVATE